MADFRVRALAFLYIGQGEESQMPCDFCWKSHSLQFFATLWQVDHYPTPESSVKPSIVQREAPKPCLARKYKSLISNTSSPWSSLPTRLGNQLINEWDSVGPFSLFHTQIWDVSYEMWPCIHYLNTLIQIFLVFSNLQLVFVYVPINSYSERNGTFSRENHMTTLSTMTTLLRKRENILPYFV